MNPEWTQMFDPLPQIKDALAGLDAQVYCRWPRREDKGTTITLSTITNRQSERSPVTDQIAVQVDLWAEERDSIRTLTPLVNAAVCGIGYRREYAGEDEQISSPGWKWRKTFRFGRKVDKRSFRLVD